MENRTNEPIYKQIALDIAGRIYNGDIKDGDKVPGRSALASNYNVSPETVRKAVKILEDMKVVSSIKGSGVIVQSKDKAYEFINRFHSIESITTLKNDIYDLIEKKMEIERDITDIIDKIVDYSNRLRYTNPLTPIEYEIPDTSEIIGKSIGESNFWQNTGATIVAIRREGELCISPGPCFIFEKGDVLLVVGEEKIISTIEKYFNKDNKIK